MVLKIEETKRALEALTVNESEDGMTLRDAAAIENISGVNAPTIEAGLILADALGALEVVASADDIVMSMDYNGDEAVVTESDNIVMTFDDLVVSPQVGAQDDFESW